MGLHAKLIGELINLFSILRGFNLLGLHAQVNGELVNLCCILGAFI